MTADAAYRRRRLFARARRACSGCSQRHREAERARARDMLERIAWAEAQPRAL